MVAAYDRTIGGETRAADAAIWRRRDLGPRTAGLRRAARVLAVEVAGEDDSEEQLRDKARWYIGAGVEAVWLILPALREVVAIDASAERRHQRGETISAESLPGLAVEIASLFVQLDEP